MEAKKRRFLSLSPDQGAVLIISLWALVILSTISIAISSLVSPQIKLAKTVGVRFASVAAADAALKFAFFERIKEQNPNYDSGFELVTPQEISLGPVTATYYLTDEESKIDINTATPEMIMRLPGLNDEKLVLNIIAYRNLRPLALKEELLLVEGISKEVFSQSQDLITVWTQGKVNVNTATEAVFRVLGLSDDLIEVISRFRKGDDGKEATPDDNIFKDVATIISDLHNFAVLTVGQVTQLQNVLSQGLLTVKSKKIKMELESKLSNQPAWKFRITFDVENNRVLRWQED